MILKTALQSFSLNAFTGGPLLQLMLAIRGEEPPSLDTDVAWEVFKQFARIPTDQGHDLISFQATWTPGDRVEAPDPPIFYVSWSRELSADDGYTRVIRAVQLQWCFDPAEGDLSDVDLWSDSYADLDAFFADIESRAEFKALLSNQSAVDLYTVDLAE